MIPKYETGQLELDDGQGGFNRSTVPPNKSAPYSNDPFSPEKLKLVFETAQTSIKEQKIFDSIKRELETATKRHGPFNSGHEGWAVIKEEVDELWEAVKRNSKNAANREAVQIAAMAVRFILDNK
jgi:hypothetical protein